ncbi:MAG: hypothetical protein LZT29_01208 [Pantoea stewartii]|uniref:HNH endonuclease n=1 Tax=Pantoea stewartii TaxID=66269 RepID=UPI0024BE3D8A|nr:HNH endonuclease [Pantoea stewartii]WHS98297.1 MAG: hypothetical protein LZT29_01208 [Pantoea stewartii]
MSVWVIYVAGISRKNYSIGKQVGVWGIKKLVKNSNFKKIKPGDDVIFIHNLTRPKNIFSEKVHGFPRVNINNFGKFEGLAAEISFSKVMEGYIYDDEMIWADDTYPHRFRFQKEKVLENVLFTVKEMGEALIKAALTSFHLKGDIAQVQSDTLSITERIHLVSDSHYALEGGASYKIHRRIERNKKIVESKKEEFIKKYGKLYCEVCGFSFEDVYGHSLKKSSIECHHINPLAENGLKETRLSDLVLLCPNCHRVLHQHNPCLDVETLIESMKKNIK